MRPRTSIAVACLLLSAACSEKAVTAPAASVPAPAAPASGPGAAAPKSAPVSDAKASAMLMQAVYGDKYRPASGDALVELPRSANGKERAMFVVSPVAHTVLPGGDTVLVANAEIAGADGKAESGHASPGSVNVYLLRQSEGRWQVAKRHENIAALGSHGKMGTVQWTTVADGKPGMAVSHGGTWQGYTVETLALFDLSSDSMRDLAGMSIHSDSDGGCNEEEYGDCWSVTGKWSLQPSKTGAPYHDLVIHFEGSRSTRAQEEDGQPKLPRITNKINASARYAYDGKNYQLVEGSNPVPEV